MVLGEHFFYDSWLNKLLPLGRMGVTLFFVLSGFLITLLLLEDRERAKEKGQWRSLWHFYARRMLRIFPAYYLTVLLLVLLQVDAAGETWPWHVSYSSSIFYFLKGGFYSVESHFWSLSVEEVFYFAWPFVILFVQNNRVLRNIILGVIGISFLTKLVLVWMGYKFIFTFPLAAFDQFAIGGMAAFAFFYRNDRFADHLSSRKWYWWMALVIFLVLLYLPLPFDRQIWPWHIFLETVMAVLSIWFIGKAVVGINGITGKVLDMRFLRFAGTISYGLYLYHPFAPGIWSYISGGTGLDQLPQYALVAIWILVSFILAAASWWLLELPLNRLKKHFK